MKKRKTILLIDGNNLGWRGFGRAPLEHNGQRTEIISIGLAMLRSYLNKFQPDKCYITWDGGLDERRVKIHPEYKRGKRRELTLAEVKERNLFFEQLNRFILTLSDVGMEQFHLRQPKREADDIIFALMIHEECSCDLDFIVVSTDKDFFQLFSIEENFCLYSPIKKELITREAAEATFGINIDYFPQYRAMMGDMGDNIPGVRGIGPAKAKWLVNNVLDKSRYDVNDDKYIQAAKKNKALIDLLHTNFETYELMQDLILFKDIERVELEAGKLPHNEFKNESEVHEHIMGICHSLGFTRFLKNFDSFVRPFIDLWRSREQ